MQVSVNSLFIYFTDNIFANIKTILNKNKVMVGLFTSRL